MDLGIKGKVAIVLGASKGIGLGCAQALAQEGVKLVICARSADKLKDASKRLANVTEVLALPCDVIDAKASRDFYTSALRRFGRVDILVNNCGGPTPGTFATTMEEEKWRDAFEKSLYQVVRWTQMAVPTMVEHKWGRVVHIVSTSVRQPIDGLLLSNSLRPGVLGFTKSVARELAATGVTVNSVLPGMILTDRTQELVRERSAREGITPAQALERKAADIPMKRFGTILEVGEAVAFLCSERASYITGEALAVDGGIIRGI